MIECKQIFNDLSFGVLEVVAHFVKELTRMTDNGENSFR